MSRSFLCAVAVCCLVFATSTANANYPCGCGQVASPCGDCYQGSVVDAGCGGCGYMGGGIAYGYGNAGYLQGAGGVGYNGGFSDGCGCGTQIQYTTQTCLLYTSPSPRDRTRSRMPSSA